jgi:hypothetical protein
VEFDEDPCIVSVIDVVALSGKGGRKDKVRKMRDVAIDREQGAGSADGHMEQSPHCRHAANPAAL